MQNRRIQGGFLYRGAIAKDKGIGKHGNRALPGDWEQQSCYHSERKREEGRGWLAFRAGLLERINGLGQGTQSAQDTDRERITGINILTPLLLPSDLLSVPAIDQTQLEAHHKGSLCWTAHQSLLSPALPPPPSPGQAGERCISKGMQKPRPGRNALTVPPVRVASVSGVQG